MADRTFSLAPTNYAQLFILMAKCNGIWCPLIYCSMKNKKENDYFVIWDILLVNASELQINRPKKPTLFIDFEKVCANAFKTVFPNGVIWCCHFHFWRAVKKQINKKGLSGLYHCDSDDFKQKCRKLVALTFLPMEEVEECFDEIAAQFPGE